MWRNAVGTFNCPIGIHKVCLGFRRIYGNVGKIYFIKSKKCEKNKNMIFVIYYFIMKLKKKVMSSHGVPLSYFHISASSEMNLFSYYQS